MGPKPMLAALRVGRPVFICNPNLTIIPGTRVVGFGTLLRDGAQLVHLLRSTEAKTEGVAFL